MLILIFLLLWNIYRSHAPTPQPVYPIPIVPVDIKAPEPTNSPQVHVPWLTSQWQEPKPGAKFMAHLFAGKAEFPFVVRIKGKEYAPCEDPADAKFNEGMGVLISADVVLSACRPVAYITCDTDTQHYEPWPDKGERLPQPDHAISIFPGSENVDQPANQCPDDKISISACSPSFLTVLYATVYLNEDNKYTDMFGFFSRDLENKFQGRRGVAEVIIHKECKPWQTLEHDVSIIYLVAPIYPFGTWIGMAPFPLNAEGRIARTDFTSMNTDRVVCYIAGFNEDYAGMSDDDQITKHYKVKFRAYLTKIDYCKQAVRVICFDKITSLLKGCWRWIKLYERMTPKQAAAAGIECWETRHKVGAVCATHVGSPLVCNNQMHGFVIKGADWRRCNNMWHLPFFVTRIHPFENFFNLQVLQGYLEENPINRRPIRPEEVVAFSERSRSSCQSENGFLLLVWAVLYLYCQKLASPQKF